MREVNVVILVWVEAGREEDFWVAESGARLLGKAMPDVGIEIVALVRERLVGKSDIPCLFIPYDEVGMALFSEGVLKRIARADLILQMPSIYPYFYSFFERVKAFSDEGLIESAKVDLSKNLLIQSDLSPVDYKEGPPFYFADLSSDKSYATYLHALLQYKKSDDIDLFVINSPCLNATDWCGYGLKEIVSSAGRIILNEGERRVVIRSKKDLSQKEREKLILRAENFVGCNDNHTLSLAIALDKFFFCESPYIESIRKISNFSSLLSSYLKCLTDMTPPSKIVGGQIGSLLQNSYLFRDMQKLITLLKTDHLYNPIFVQFVKSKLEGALWKKSLTAL